MKISLALRARDIFTSRLTSNQWYIGQQITVSKNLFLKQNSNWIESAMINLPTAIEQLRAAIFEGIRNAQIKAVQTVSISLLSATFSCVLHLWFKRCYCDVVYNDVTRDSIACSLTLPQVTENRYVKYPVHNSWRYESIVLTNRIAGKRMNIKKLNHIDVTVSCSDLWMHWSFRTLTLVSLISFLGCFISILWLGVLS